MEEDLFVSCRPQITLEGDHGFKYHVDFDRLPLDEGIGAMCVSRPTNPTSNVLTDEEMEHLARLASERGIPLIVDNAYGAPFPGLIYRDARPPWGPNTVLVFSLSKFGLPGSRTGIVVADPEVVQALSAVNAIANADSAAYSLDGRQPFLAGNFFRSISNGNGSSRAGT